MDDRISESARNVKKSDVPESANATSLNSPTLKRGSSKQDAASSFSFTFLTYLVVSALGISFGLATGIAFGVTNHHQYLLHGLHALDPSILANDWFTESTRAHHIAFTPLIVAFARVGPLPVLFAAANICAAVVLVWCLYALAKRWYPHPILVAAITVFFLTVIPRPYIGLTGLLTMIFQPATIGAIGLFTGLTLIALERNRAAGLIMGLAAIFHINYMVWAIVIVGALVLIEGRKLDVRRALWLVIPLGIAVLFHLPFALESRSAEQLAAASKSQWILHDLYMPYHSRPLTWGSERVIQFLAVLTLGVIAYRIAPPKNITRDTRHIVAILGSVVFGSLICNSIVTVDLIALLFPWRLSPFVVTGSVLLAAGAWVRIISDRKENTLPHILFLIALSMTLQLSGVTRYGLQCGGAIALLGIVYKSQFAEKHHLISCLAMLSLGIAVAVASGMGPMKLTVVAAAIASSLLARLACNIFSKTKFERGIRGARSVPMVIMVCFVILLTARDGLQRKDILGRPVTPHESELYAWCRTTPIGSRFIVPPEFRGFRLLAQRAVVVDWKCMPILPADTLQWYRRLVDITGIEFTTKDQCFINYRTMDCARVEKLAQKYDTQYLVVRSGQYRPDLEQLPLAWENERFRIFQIRQGSFALSDRQSTPDYHLAAMQD